MARLLIKKRFGNLWSKLTPENIQLCPIRKTVRQYTWLQGKQDIRAGINVALLAFPQGMAFALIAGLPVLHGLIATIVSALVAPIFATSRHIALGPTNATAVLVLSTLLALQLPQEQVLLAIPILLLLVGVFLIAGAYLRVAILIQYISRSVITGYITAAACLIIVNQVKNILGLPKIDSSSFVGVLWESIQFIPDTDLHSLLLAGITLGLYLGLQKFNRRLPNVAITLILSSLIAWGLQHAGMSFTMLHNFSLTDITLAPPALDFDLLGKLAGPALAIAFLCSVETISIGKSLAARSGHRLDTNQEIFAAGLANLFNSFFQGMPASGSLTRSTLNWVSGAATPLANLICGALCLGLLLVLSSYIGYIPQTALAVLVVCVGVSLIHRKQIRTVVRSTQSDAIVFTTTFIGGLLFPLDTAIFLGTGISIFLFLRKASTPELVEYTFNDEGHLTELEQNQSRLNPHISIVHVEGDLFFGAAELFQDQIRRVCEDQNLKIVILRMKNAHHLDATSVMSLEELIQFMRQKDRDLIVSGARKEVYRVFRDSGVLDILGKQNFFLESPRNPNLSTRKALMRAQEIIGTDQEPEIKIYYDPKKSGTPH